jgi:hypothetical protein
MSKIFILNTKDEKLDADIIIAIDPEKVTAIAVERSLNNDAQKYGIRITGAGLNLFAPIIFSVCSKMTDTEQKKFLMKLQAKMVKTIWGDTTLETYLTSEKLGL